MTYPTTLPNLTATNPTPANTLATAPHSTLHTDERIAIDALAAKVGVDSSAVTTTHEYKLSGVTGSDKAGSTGATLAQFAATTSAQLAGVVSDETGTNKLVFSDSPTLVTPALGTPSALVGTNITGTAAGLTAGTVTTNANLTGPVTSVGNATTIADAELAAIAGLTSAADKGIQFTGSGTAATYDLTTAGKALLDDADATAQRVTLGLVIGTNVQAQDAELAAIAGLTSAADKGIQFTGSGTAATYDLTTAGKALLDDANAAAQVTTLGLDNTKIAALPFIIDGGGSVITTGIKGDLEIPFGCTINRVTVLGDQSGSIVIDVWKDTYANYPPTVADTITASAKPTLSTATKSQDATLTGWTTAISAGDTLRFNVDSITTLTRVLISLKVTKT